MEYKYNDNELLYLIREGTIEAEDILYDKYMFLIKKRISSFKIQKRYKDDFFQEGLMCLSIAINSFNDAFNKSFNKYFDLIMQRRFIALLKKDQEYFYAVTLVDNYAFINDRLEEERRIIYEDEEFRNNKLNDYIQEIKQENLSIKNKINKLLLKGLKPSQIATVLDCNIKKVYNEIYSIKIKSISTNYFNSKIIDKPVKK